MESKEVDASLEHFRFGKDIEVMLPEQVREWWVQHGLAGSIDIPTFRGARPGKNGQRMRVPHRDRPPQRQPRHPAARSGSAARRASAWSPMRESMRLMRDARPGRRRASSSNLEALFNPSVDRARQGHRAASSSPRTGSTSSGSAGGWRRTRSRSTGGSTGTPRRPSRRITVEGKNVTIPHAPRYVNSLPPAFRELYDHLRPEGDGVAVR